MSAKKCSIKIANPPNRTLVRGEIKQLTQALAAALVVKRIRGRFKFN